MMKKILWAFLLAGCYAVVAAPPNQASKSVSLTTFGADPTGTFDISGVFLAALNSGATHIDVPPGQYLLNGTATVPLTNVEIDCHGAPAGDTTPPAFGASGATFLMTSTSVQPFTVANDVRMKGCNAFWPNQTGANPSPIVYPPLFTEASGKQINAFILDDVRIINAYDVFDQAATTDAFGDIKVSNATWYCIRYCFQLANVTEYVTVTGGNFDATLYHNSGADPNRYLIDYTGANGAIFHVFGNGNGTSTTSTVNVGGILWSGNGVFDYNKLVWVDSTGAISESKFTGIYDAVATVFQVDAGGCAVDTEIDGEYYSYMWKTSVGGPGGPDHQPTFTIGAPVGTCTDSNFRFTGHLYGAQGDVLDVSGSNIKGIYLSISGSGKFGQSSTAGTYYFANINGANVILDAAGNHVEPKTVGATSLGFNIQNCFSCTLNGNSFNGIYNAIILGTSTVPVSGAGNLSVNSPSGATPISGTGDYAHQLLTGGNSWDKYALPGVSSCGTGGALSNGHSSDISGVVSVGSGTVTSCTLTFANAWTNTPRCSVTGLSISSQPLNVAPSTSGFVLTTNATMNAQAFSYHCDAGW